jgi:polyisoprenyl-phosphate glycosyltransferase
VFNHADFRLLSRRAIESLKLYSESNLFLRGVVRELGYQSTTVEYERHAREAGESKYPLRKMLSFAWKGITAFSTAPLRLITILGLVSGFASFALILWVLFIRFVSDTAIPGWASLLLPLLFIGSIQLICLGIIGEYLGKIYEEVKRRPKFHISEIIKRHDDNQG